MTPPHPTAVKALVLSSALALGCAKPFPPVSPAPEVTDEFAGKTADCSDPAVAEERGRAQAPVEECMEEASGDVDAASACMVALSGTYSLDTLACVARDRGALAWASIASTSSAWIKAHDIGYR